MTIQIIYAVTEIFTLFIIGALLRVGGYIDERDIDRWSKTALDVLLPFYTFTSILKGIDPTRINELWLLPVIGFGQVIFFFVCALPLMLGLRNSNWQLRRTFLHLCTVNNSSFLPVIILRNMWGDKYIATLFIHYLGTAIGVWTIGVGVLETSSLKDSIKNIFKPTLIAIILATLIAVFKLNFIVPKILFNALSSAGSITIPLIMILIGANLANRKNIDFSWKVIYLTIVRLIILPLLMVPVLNILPIPKDFYNIAVIVSLMPTAVTSVIITRRYGGNSSYATSAALVTTLLSIITVPLAMNLIFK